MAENKVRFLRGTATEYVNTVKNDDTFYYTTDDGKFYIGEHELTSDGNADTLDGLHADVFLRYLGYLTSDSILTKALELNESGFVYCSDAVTDLPESNKYFFVDIRKSTNTIQLTATKFNNGATYTNRYNSDLKTWYGWKNIADGGNADTLDGLHAVDFSQIVDFGSTSTDTKTAVGIEGKCTVYRCSSWTDYPAALTNGQGHIIAINYKGTGTAGSDSMWVRQIYISANTSITDPRLYQRYISSSNLSDWKDIADGGNAATVGGRSITVTDVDPGSGSALGTGEIVFVTEVT